MHAPEDTGAGVQRLEQNGRAYNRLVPRLSSSPLSPFGVGLWRVRSADAGQARVIPDAAMDIVYSQGALRFAGADTREFFVASHPGATTWGLRLAPGAAHALFGMPMDELTNRREPLDTLVALPAQLRDAVAAEPRAGMRQLARALHERAEAGGRPVQELLRFAASIDRAAKAGLSAREIAQAHSLSDRHLRRVSGRVFGYGVKSLASIHRLQRALDLGRSGLAASAAAAHAGYADQAHLARDAKRLTGATFGELLR